MTSPAVPSSRQLAQALHDISRMIISAADMHRNHTRLLFSILEAGANTTDVLAELRANEEMFTGYLARIGAVVDTLRMAVLNGGQPEALP